MSLKWDDNRGPITAICRLSDSIAAIGVGPDLQLVDLEHRIVFHQVTLSKLNNKIHGISLKSNKTPSNPPVLLVWGGLETWILSLDNLNSARCVISILDEFRWKEWIMTASFIESNGDDDWFCVSFVRPKVSIRKYGDGCCIGESLEFPNTSCNLYSAAIYGNVWKDESMTLAFGTAFGQIYVWSGHDCEMKVIDRAHDGSVFGVNLFKTDSGRLLLSSVSDDRSIRIWDANYISDDNQKPLATLYGHEARIWKTEFNPLDPSGDTLFSISEDCTLKLWNWKESLSMIQSWSDLHRGKNVWSLSLPQPSDDGRHFILTGGGDAALIKIPFEKTEDSFNTFALPLDGIRSFCLHSDGVGIVCVTVDGNVYLFKASNDSEPELVYYHDSLKYNSVISTMPGGCIVIGDSHGNLHLINEDGGAICKNDIFNSGQGIKSLHVLGDDTLGVCGFSSPSQFTVIESLSSVEKRSFFQIPIAKKLQITSCVLFNGLLIIGTVQGIIQSYQVRGGQTDESPFWTYMIPSKSRITSLLLSSNSLLATSQCGRLFTFDLEAYSLMKSEKITLGALERIHENILIGAYHHAYEFYVEQRKIWSVPSATIKHPWTFRIGLDGSLLEFFLLKGSQLSLYRSRKSLAELSGNRPIRILPGTHGREIRSVLYHESARCFITGCEEGYLKFWDCQSCAIGDLLFEFKVQRSLIKCMASTRSLLITGGARGEISLLSVHRASDNRLQVQVLSDFTSSICAGKGHNDLLSVRVMALEFISNGKDEEEDCKVLVAFSNGDIGVLAFDPVKRCLVEYCNNKSFVQLESSCPFSLLKESEKKFWVGCSDGRIRGLSLVGRDLSFTRILERAHSRAVHGMSICSKKKYLASCSEDGSVAFYDLLSEGSPKLIISFPSCHLASVQKIMFVPSCNNDNENDEICIAVSNDQTCSTFRLGNQGLETGTWNRDSTISKSIKTPDVSDACLGPDNQSILVVGIGMNLIKFGGE